MQILAASPALPVRDVKKASYSTVTSLGFVCDIVAKVSHLSSRFSRDTCIASE
jgi:hypothetical protein